METIDVNALEWFDKVNGNSYFAAIITLDYGTDQAQTIKLPFQYGYGSHYIDMAKQELFKLGLLPDLEQYSNGASEALWSYCRRNNIILRTSKKENCLKRDLKAI